MINSSYADRIIEMFPGEIRLIYQAKSGDANAFVELYDSHVERVYRYIHFLVPNNSVAEGLTFQVFCKAWEQFDRYQMLGISFIGWLYLVARNQVGAYSRSHKNHAAPDNEFTLAARGGAFREEIQAIRDALKFLTADQQHVLILKFVAGLPDRNIARLITKREEDVRVFLMHSLYALTDHLIKADSRTITRGFRRILEDCLMRIASDASTLDECLARYPSYAAQLEPLLETALHLDLGRDVKPLSTFNAYTHDALIHYLRSHPRRQQRTFVVIPTMRRTALTFAVLVAALLVTGTAYAQSALPGDTFYTWKRTSEQIWYAVSPDPVSTDIILAERRLDEWIAVADDPAFNTSAMNDYEDAVSKLESTEDVGTLTLIASALQGHQKSLKSAGLSSPELDNYLIKVSALLPDIIHPEDGFVEVLPTVTAVSPTNTATGIVADSCALNCENNKDNNSFAAGLHDNNGLGPDDNPGLGPNDNPGLGPNDNPGLGPNDNPGLGPNDNPGLGQDENNGADPDNNGKGH